MVSEALRPAPSTATPVERLAYLAAQPSIQAALAAVREIMGVEIACTTYITDAGQQVIEQVDGDGATLGIVPAASFDFDLTFCKRVLAGELPPLVADVDENPPAASVPILRRQPLRHPVLRQRRAPARLARARRAVPRGPGPGHRSRDRA